MLSVTERTKISERRKQLLDYINKHPEKKLIQVDKDELEELLFETNYALGYDANLWGQGHFKLPPIKSKSDIHRIYSCTNDIKKNAVLAKFPVWTGEFLRRIDLSEIDWSNVVWNPEVISELDIIWLYDMENFLYITKPLEIPLGLDNDSSIENSVDLSFTNAKIDFSKSFCELALNGANCLYQCNFRGVDLSQSNTDSISTVLNCDLESTNFKINKNEFYAFSSNLRTIDLTKFKTTFSSSTYGADRFNCCFDNCILTNTGLYVYVNTENCFGDSYYFDNFIKNVEKGYYDGCTLNMGIIDLNEDYDDDYEDDNDFDDNDDYGLGFKF